MAFLPLQQRFGSGYLGALNSEAKRVRAIERTVIGNLPEFLRDRVRLFPQTDGWVIEAPNGGAAARLRQLHTSLTRWLQQAVPGEFRPLTIRVQPGQTPEPARWTAVPLEPATLAAFEALARNTTSPQLQSALETLLRGRGWQEKPEDDPGPS